MLKNSNLKMNRIYWLIQKILGSYCFILLWINVTQAQRLSLGFEYQLHASRTYFTGTIFTGGNSGNKYERLEPFTFDNKDSSSADWYGRAGLGLSWGLMTGIHRRNWSIKTGFNLCMESIRVVFKRLGNETLNNIDTLIITIPRQSFKIPFRFQYSIASIWRSKSFFVIETGFNYVLFEKMPAVKIEKMEQRILRNVVDNAVAQDARLFTNFQNNRLEFILGMGFLTNETSIFGKRQFMLRTQFFLNQIEGQIAHFHIFGFSTTGDFLGGKLLRKRKKIYAR
jgi:hypothetical protein